MHAGQKRIFLQSQENSTHTFNNHCLIRWTKCSLKAIYKEEHFTSCFTSICVQLVNINCIPQLLREPVTLIVLSCLSEDRQVIVIGMFVFLLFWSVSSTRSSFLQNRKFRRAMLCFDWRSFHIIEPVLLC